MSDVVGRAGFHVAHAKKVSERAAILHEAMRELDDDAVQYWASRNPNIVVDDERLDEAMANDGAGGYTRCTSWGQVLDYGQARVGRLGRKLRDDQPDKHGRMSGGTVTTTMIVAHLPKSMCKEIPDYYPRWKQDGSPMLDPTTGEQLMRSRWVARDREEARQYFEDVLGYVSSDVLPGGQESVLGYDIQHSESTPHIQIVADAFADNPSKPGTLRAAASEAWFSHRNVRNKKGKVKTGPEKLRDYHAGLKAHLIQKGYDVSADFDAERHMVGHTKENYVATQEALSETEAVLAAMEQVEADLSRREAALASSQEAWKVEEPQLRQEARKEGYEEGRAKAEAAEQAAKAAKDQAEQRTHEAEVARAHYTTELGKIEGLLAGLDNYEPPLPPAYLAPEEVLDQHLAHMPKVLDDFFSRFTQGEKFRKGYEVFANDEYKKIVHNAQQTGREVPEKAQWLAQTVSQVEKARRDETVRTWAAFDNSPEQDVQTLDDYGPEL